MCQACAACSSTVVLNNILYTCVCAPAQLCFIGLHFQLFVLALDSSKCLVHKGQHSVTFVVQRVCRVQPKQGSCGVFVCNCASGRCGDARWLEAPSGPHSLRQIWHHKGSTLLPLCPQDLHMSTYPYTCNVNAKPGSALDTAKAIPVSMQLTMFCLSHSSCWCHAAKP